MTYKQWTLHKLVMIFVLSTTFSITQVALADYQPPDDQKPPRDSSDALEVKLLISDSV